MQKSKIHFPYGISNLEVVATENYVFIDKTPFIQTLEIDSKVKYAVFLRPRRIGKSLFVSVLEYYYDMLRKDKFDKIFGNYYIGKNPTPLANTYRVLKLDFSGIDTGTNESSFSGFVTNIQNSLINFLKANGFYHESIESKLFAQSNPAELMNTFFGIYKGLTNDKIYLIIDEYDHFTNEILIRDLGEFKASVSSNGYVRKFYEAVKIATQAGIVDRFFITGVSPITLDSVTSGFNIVTHLTNKADFHDMMGFMEDEVQSLVEMILEDKSRLPQIMNDLKLNYNGYKFHPAKEHTIYNSDMVLFFLEEFKSTQEYPRLMLDPNIMPDYGKLKKMFQMANWEDNIDVLETILKEQEITCSLIYQFNFEKGFRRTEFVNFLYYLGNLTIKGENEVSMPIFKIPNLVIGELYWEYYANVLQERAKLPYEEDKVRPAVLAMALGNEKPFFELVERNLEVLSNRDYLKFDEKYIKLLLISYTMQGSIFYVRSEREIGGNVGYVDVEFLVKPNNPKSHAQYVFEVKYLKKEDENLLEIAQAAAEKQLRNYLEKDEILQGLTKLKAFTVVVVKSKVYMKEIV
jgi:hypothetical protein